MYRQRLGECHRIMFAVVDRSDLVGVSGPSLLAERSFRLCMFQRMDDDEIGSKWGYQYCMSTPSHSYFWAQPPCLKIALRVIVSDSPSIKRGPRGVYTSRLVWSWLTKMPEAVGDIDTGRKLYARNRPPISARDMTLTLVAADLVTSMLWRCSDSVGPPMELISRTPNLQAWSTLSSISKADVRGGRPKAEKSAQWPPFVLVLWILRRLPMKARLLHESV